MNCLTHEVLDALVAPGPRLPWIQKWLIEHVWTLSAYDALAHSDYLKQGEERVNRFEELLATSADRIYKELLSPPKPERSVLSELKENTAVVIFDGLSLREIPVIIKLAAKSGFDVREIDCAIGAVPSETVDFIEREFSCGRLSPTQLPGRSELKSKGITTIYTNNITQSISTRHDSSQLLIWSAFPDNTYSDSGSKFERHFETIHVQFETAWIHSVQQIKGRSTIIITSDHGYVFFGTGMDRMSPDTRELNGYFGNNRNVSLSEQPNPPLSDDVVIDENRGVAMVKGRVRTRSTGEAAAQLYKHGGLSLMEMLTPWVVLEKRGG